MTTTDAMKKDQLGTLTFSEKYDYWSGCDNAPGGLTWREWERDGITESQARNCAPNEADAERFSELSLDRFVTAMDDLWGHRVNGK